jgi:hypothetical protein
MKVPLFCMKLIRTTSRIGNPGPICARIFCVGILTMGSPERVPALSLTCPTMIPASFGHWLMPVNVLKSLWKLSGFRGLPSKMPFRNNVYESTPFLHEIDPDYLPDWQSGPGLCPVLFRRDTVRDIPKKSPYTLRPCPPAIPAPFGQWLMPVNVFKISLEIVWIPRITQQNAFPEQRA